ncbi:MAG: BamA/TamA family outer membrane protein [Paucibacter sp.]|nr:BamA/TamA family outer membrane protein [Roseateles sp.]
MRFPGTVLLGLALALLQGCSALKSWNDRPPGEAAAPQPSGKIAYQLDVQAPGPLRALLLQHLDLARFQRIERHDGKDGQSDERLSAVELDRLSAAAPAQAQALAETQGFFNARATVRVEGSEQEPRVVLQVDPGAVAHVSRLSLDFSSAMADLPPLPGAAALRQLVIKQWPLVPGQAFSQSAWSDAKQQALMMVRAKGYPLAKWGRSHAKVLADDNSVELDLVLDSGPQFKLGEIEVDGVQHQSADTVRHLAGFKPGDAYTEQALLDFQERLLASQLFDGASVTILPELENANAAPVYVHIKEGPLQTATTGVGYHSDDGPRATLDYVNRAPLGLPVRGAAKLEYGSALKSATLEISSRPQPDLQRKQGSLQYEETNIAGSDITNSSARLGRVRETRVDEHVSYIEALHSREITAVSDISANALSINTQRIWRRVDNLMLPTQGHTGLLLLGTGVSGSSDADRGPFGRFQLKLNGYLPLGADWLGSARTEIGEVIAKDSTGLPNKLLFQAGGEDSVRGYGYRSLGPKDSAGITIGGRMVWTGSLEAAHPIRPDLPNLLGAVFVDAGNAANTWRDLNPVLGYGAGLRWRSPFGPLKLDFAHGQANGDWRIQFSVGVAL